MVGPTSLKVVALHVSGPYIGKAWPGSALEFVLDIHFDNSAHEEGGEIRTLVKLGLGGKKYWIWKVAI